MMHEEAIDTFKKVQEQFQTFILLEREIYGGGQIKLQFNNGWGASLIHHDFSYGNESGLCEVAVEDFNGDICYKTTITDDVIGYLTREDVLRYLNEIQKLPVNI